MGFLVPVNDRVKGVKFRIFEPGPEGKICIFYRGVGGEGGHNKLK